MHGLRSCRVMLINSSHDEGGVAGVWLRVRILNSLVFNFRTTVRAMRGSFRDADHSLSTRRRIMGCVPSSGGGDAASLDATRLSDTITSSKRIVWVRPANDDVDRAQKVLGPFVPCS